MEFDPETPQYLTSDPSSFASVSANERWPVIITGAIDDLHRTVIAANDTEKENEGKSIIANLAKLKYELQHNRQLTPIEDDGHPDIASYNQELEQRGNPVWHDAPWLYAECYLYRRIESFFALSKHWKGYDVFARQKMSTFKSSRPAVLELAARYRELALEAESGKGSKGKSPEEIEEAEKLLFSEMCEICLWGNATDLSLLTSLTYEDIQKLQGSEARKASQSNILRKKDGERRVDIVLDNSGFELFVDLILAGYLLSTGLATTVVIHPKRLPWFVSDVTPRDFSDLLNCMVDPQAFYTAPDDSGKTFAPLSEKEVSDVRFLFEQWSEFHQDGKLIVRPHAFWTTQGGYWRLPKVAPELFDDLKESELVLFKGDLNYRKLVNDATWDPTTAFTTAIGPMGPKSGIRVLAFRTCKADTVVGLPVGVDEKLRQQPGGGDEKVRKWAWSGKWAVVSFSDGKA
ncbi:hypothetical protein N7486_002291 [Penicillium sp. IBT 16267x]|nr:hypothetical protein N7486_002291 [Penicillium sp. IBT 16267x]